MVTLGQGLDLHGHTGLSALNVDGIFLGVLVGVGVAVVVFRWRGAECKDKLTMPQVCSRQAVSCCCCSRCLLQLMNEGPLLSLHVSIISVSYPGVWGVHLSSFCCFSLVHLSPSDVVHLSSVCSFTFIV